jgi:hypothetical protein
VAFQFGAGTENSISLPDSADFISKSGISVADHKNPAPK